MQLLYSTSTPILIILNLILLGFLIGLLRKLYTLRKMLQLKDYLAGILFIPVFTYLLVVSVGYTFNILTAQQAQCTSENCEIVSGPLMSREYIKGPEARAEHMLIKIGGKELKIDKIVLNPYLYNYSAGNEGFFDKIGTFYQLYVVDGMIINIQSK
ncbi:hypothetical protein PCNPT3_06950 [Psychromonas sp. CNPT3]|uniref:hypothetical protein n=1 Tax=Psychromonas sp. CNPT3 TaxID=314282 RepID=UPI00006E56B2|nr:hypothetical protein [Psychromonas sp. CNPT3]AGH81328.1 hypothetical protein PCNPT3_06950 [Psychromonas sp. CNPT3]